VRRILPKFADRSKKILRPFLGLIIVFICTFGVYVNLYMFRLMTWRVLLGGMGLPWLGFVSGLVIAVLSRQPKPNVVAISIETGIQNTGIAIMLLQLSFVQPDADLAAVLPVVVAMFTPAPMILALLVHYIMKCRMEKTKKQEKVAVMCNGKSIEDGTGAIIYKSSDNDHQGITVLDHESNGAIAVSNDDEEKRVPSESEIYGNGFVRNQEIGEKTKMLEVSG